MSSQDLKKEIVVAIDPGRDKCGIAVVSRNLELLLKEIVSRDETVHRIFQLVRRYKAQKVILGDRTGSRKLAHEINKVINHLSESIEKQPMIPEIIFVDEHKSSLEGRYRYLLDHPLSGLLKLIPLSLRTPKEPFDDYVAVILAERFFQHSKRQ